MSIFTLGLLRGASQQYLRTKEAEAAEEAQIRAEKRADERQRELINLQNENAKFAAGRAQFFTEQNNRQNQEFQIAQAENNVEQQRRLMSERINLETEARNAQVEEAIINTFGYIAEEGPEKGKFVGVDYEGKKRLPDATEMPLELQRRVRDGVPVLLPPVLGTLPGFDNFIKQNNSVSMGMMALSKGLHGADPDFSSGNLVLNVEQEDGTTGEKIISIPAVNEGQGDAKSRSRANTLLVMETVSEYEDLVPQVIDEYANGNYDNYNTLVNALKKNGGSALRESLKMAQTEGKDMVVQNPIDFYGLLTQVKGKKNQDWFAQTVLTEVLGFSVDTMKILMGDPSEIDYTYDQVNNRIIRPNEDNWKWATEYDPSQQRFVMKQDIWKQVQDVAKYNGVPNHIILGLVKDHKNPLLALQDIAKTRTELENTVYMSSGVLQVTQDAKDLINQKLTESGYNTTEDQILYVRSLIKENPNARPKTVAISATGDISPKYQNRKNTYKIDGEQARQMAEASARAAVLADASYIS